MINTDRSDEPEPPLAAELDARFKAQIDTFLARAARKRAERAEFVEARRHGLRRRHAQKLSRNHNQRESTEPKE